MGLPQITITSPTSGYASASPVLAFDVTYTDFVDSLTASSVVFDIDTVNTFDSGNLKTFSYATIASGAKVRCFPTLADGSYYWRVTMTNATGTTVSTTETFTVTRVLNRTLYQYENVGIQVNRFTNKRVLYQYENVGVQLDRFTDMRALYLYENIIAYVPKRRVVIFI